jgi:hypothetical protein
MTITAVLTAALVAGGCARNGEPAVAGAAPERPDAAAALRAATDELRKDTFRLAITLDGDRGEVTGVADPRTGETEIVLVSDSPAPRAPARSGCSAE